ncbi:LPXTG cell wall anchor domain-containing protein [Murdochiella sp. Marseille-P8839]|nr:LPXTG cell wall anchor domain-containing protein [Murdochiella sp. Marseille-P8839]
MKTKRIVALALASALALGAVATPVLAAPTATEVKGLTSSEAYAKIIAAQQEVVKEAQKKFDDAKKAEKKKAKDWADAKEAVKDAKLEVIEAQQAIDAANKQIDYWMEKQTENRNNKDMLELDYAEQFDGLGNILEDDAAYIRAIEIAEKEGNAELAQKLKDAQQWVKDNNIEKLNRDDKWYAKSIELKKDELVQLNQTKAYKDLLLKEAEAAEKAAQLAWAQAFQDMEMLEDELNLREVELNKIKTFQRKATEEMIKGETNPKLAELAAKDYVAYWLAKLVYDEEVLLPETVKKLNLGEEILKQYHDILGDEETMEPKDSESQNTEAPKPDDTQAPKPDTTEEAPKPDTKPEVKPEDKKEEKKDDKKVAPKTGDIAVLAYAGSAVLAAGAFVASKKRK